MELLHIILSFLAIISVIVFIHEFGHYLFAKLCGVRVEVFSIGFGKELFGINDRSGTRWKFSLLPLGGYVKMFGDEGSASVPAEEKLAAMGTEDRAHSFHFKPLWKKALIVAGGPLFNFLLTISIFTGFILTNGIRSSEPVVGEILPDSAALTAGLKVGDRFVSINGYDVEDFNDISLQIATNLGTSVDAVIVRDRREQTIAITPKLTEVEDAFGNKVPVPRIGIVSKELTAKDIGIFGALGIAVERTYDIAEKTLEVLGQLITLQRDPQELKGPIGIAQLSGQATETGLSGTLWFLAMLSVNLGLVNLLPIPLLDGGHLLYYGVEAVRGRPMAIKVQQVGFRIGFALLATLMAFTIVNDIIQLV